MEGQRPKRLVPPDEPFVILVTTAPSIVDVAPRRHEILAGSYEFVTYRHERGIPLPTADLFRVEVIMLPFKRKKLFVNRGIQGAMALRFGLYWVMYHICLWNGAFMYFFLRARLGQLTGSDEPMLSLSEMYAHFLKEYIPITAAATLLLPIVIHELIRQTHRIAGPLVRFSHAMRDMMAGKTIPPVKLREGDMLTEFETLFNEFVAFHQSKVQALARIETQTLSSIEVSGHAAADEESQLLASNAAM